jgi:hypothetical protein
MEKGTSKHDGQQTTEREPLVIRSGKRPPSEHIMKVLRHSKTATRINERILSGLQVDHTEWEVVKRSTGELHDLLANVVYQWSLCSPNLMRPLHVSQLVELHTVLYFTCPVKGSSGSSHSDKHLSKIGKGNIESKMRSTDRTSAYRYQNLRCY